MKPTIYVGADHGGWELKEKIEQFLREKKYKVIDMGNQNLVNDDDYPDFGHAVAKRVMTDANARGIVFCSNAQGICIVANKVKGVRAATGFNKDIAKTSRTDDNANILCLPGKYMKIEEAKEIVNVWLSTDFSNAERHKRRLKKIEDIESKEFNV